MKIISLTISLGFLFFSNFNAVCQNDSLLQSAMNKQLIQPYIQQNSAFKEQVYVHFNKSCYLPGDDIWFQTYVINPFTGLLNPYTTNLYVELYNQDGKLIGQKILPVNAGTANNVFTLKEQALPGQYTFRAYTNWMKNFYSTEEFDTHLEIVGDASRENSANEPIYDIQFFAESGTLLEGIFNKVALKALDPNGKSVVFSGEIIDNENNSIAAFKLNQMGMGEFAINPGKKLIYKAKITLPNGKEQFVTLPHAESKGVIASVNVFLNNKIGIEVKSNPETIENGKIFYILIHNNGHVYKTLSTKLSPDRQSVSFMVDHSEIGNGVNCLTVFDENFQPVAERLFYNNKMSIRGNVDIQQKFVNDSVQLNIAVGKDSGKRRFSNMSLSVLPEGTISNHFNNSLLSDILLKSGVRGNIENPRFYFEKEDRDHSIAMDLLLLTQGWRKYDWNENITTNKKTLYDFDKGFSIVGKVKNWLNGKEDKASMVSLLSPENKIFRLLKVDSVGHFSFPNLYLKDSSRVMVSASSAKGKSWNRTILASVEPNIQLDSTVKVKSFIYFANESQDKNEPPLKLLPGVIQLPEFTVTAEKAKPFERNMYVSAFDKSFEITKDNYSKYSSLETLLAMEFNLRVHVDMEGNYKIDMGRGPRSSMPKLYIDEVEAPDLNFLSMYTIDQIEAISVNKDGNAFVGDGGAIVIKTRTTPVDWISVTPTNLKFIKVKGFASHVEYYTPKYLQTPETETYQKYASIFWKPGIVTDSTGNASFRFSIPKELNVVNVRTEGISSDGTIYLDERKIAIKREN